jgi:hypothetical protein
LCINKPSLTVKKRINKKTGETRLQRFASASSLHRQRFVIRHCIVSASSSVIASSTIASSTFRWCMAFWNEAGLRTRIPMPAEDLGLFVDDDAQRAGPGGPDDLDEAERAVVLPM